jgi:hypothetical protein
VIELGDNDFIVPEKACDAVNLVEVFHLLHEFCAVFEVLVELPFKAVFLLHFHICPIILQLLFLRFHVLHEVLQRSKMIRRVARLRQVNLRFVHSMHQATERVIHGGGLIRDHVMRLVEFHVARLLVEVFDLVELFLLRLFLIYWHFLRLPDDNGLSFAGVRHLGWVCIPFRLS